MSSRAVPGHFFLNTRRPNLFTLVQSIIFFAVFAFLAVPLEAAQPSTTALAITSNGTPATSIAQGAVATLTATVSQAGSPVVLGQVVFCDATAPFCTDIHRVGISQLTTSGTAVFHFTPAIGTHSYKAVFLGTNGFTTSSSTTEPLTVTGLYLTSTTITSSGTPGAYTLNAAVTSSSPASPTSTVSFVDVTNGGAPLATSSLGPVTTGPITFSSASSPGVSGVATATGDFNHDGIVDVVTIDSLGNLNVGLGNGDGTFRELTPTQPFSYTFIEGIVTADFNSDGNLDLAVIGSSNNVTILLGHGDGTFTVKATPATGQFPVALTVADWNMDGIPDLAIANDSSNNVTILLGQGDGTFVAAPTSPVTTNNSPGLIATGDFNGDGKPDFIVVTLSDYNATVFLGDGTGAFTAAAPAAAGGFDVDTLAVADFNGDGKADFAINIMDSVFIFLGNGDGTFTAAGNISATPSGNFPTSMKVGDFNGDGIPDLAFVSGNSNAAIGPTILQGKGDGTFTQFGPFTGTHSESLSVADFNGDGYSDLGFLLGYAGNTPLSILLAQNTVSASTTASSISLTGVGTHQVEASYAGDSNFAPSISATIGLLARTVPPALTLSAAPMNSTYGQQVVFTTSLTPSTAQNQNTDGEPVTFFNGATKLGSVALASGTASLNVTSLPSGSDTITASYAGDANFLTALSNAIPYSVARASSTTAITTSASPSVTGANITFTASVTPATSGTPTGSVVFMNGSATLATVPLTGSSATYTSNALTIGSYSITAVYSGDANFTGSVSSTLSQVITGVPDFSLSTAASTLTVQLGQTGTLGLTITPTNGFNQTVTFSCTGLPSYATCSFSPASVTPAGTTATTQLTVATTASSAMLREKPAQANPWGMTTSVALGFLICLCPTFERIRTRKLLGLFTLLAALLVIQLTGCASSANNTSATNNPAPTTQSSQISVVASSGTGTGATQHTVALTITTTTN